jgi:regulation of enolase protein 1 (concanavalin A-like superfamily)
VAKDGALSIRAGGQTDWFIDPGTGASTRDAPALVMPAQGAWQLSALVSVEHRAMFAAGVLFLHADAVTWAKLCLERSPQGESTVVSVVTRGTSDDCNSVIVAGHDSYLRISCLEGAFAFHHSTDGGRWSLVRYFTLGDGADEVAVGFSAQSPTGDGCTATFSDITFRPTLLVDLRSGA